MSEINCKNYRLLHSSETINDGDLAYYDREMVYLEVGPSIGKTVQQVTDHWRKEGRTFLFYQRIGGSLNEQAND